MDNPLISANRLLNRKPDAAYIEEWTDLIKREIPIEKRLDEQSVVLFRLAEEWLALDTAVFAEIAHVRPIHRIPHRSTALVLGLINLRGQLQLCFSLHNLLQLESREKYARMVAMRQKREIWIFPVDEVYGNHRYTQLENVPVTVSKSTANYLKGVIAWEGKSVGVLDAELLFQSLKRSLQ